MMLMKVIDCTYQRKFICVFQRIKLCNCKQCTVYLQTIRISKHAHIKKVTNPPTVCFCCGRPYKHGCLRVLIPVSVWIGLAAIIIKWQKSPSVWGQHLHFKTLSCIGLGLFVHNICMMIWWENSIIRAGFWQNERIDENRSRLQYCQIWPQISVGTVSIRCCVSFAVTNI